MLVSTAPELALTPFGQAVWLSPLKWVVMLAPLAFTLVLSFRWEKMSMGALLGTFYAFSAAMGLSLSSVFVIYKLGSIAQVFFITAAMFAGTSLWGYTTKRDLSGMGKMLTVGAIMLLVAGLVNIFLQSPALQFAISCIGVLATTAVAGTHVILPKFDPGEALRAIDEFGRHAAAEGGAEAVVC